MSIISFLHEDGSGKINTKEGTEAMDFEIEGNPYNLNKLTDFEEYLKNKPMDMDIEMSENNIEEAASDESMENASVGKGQKYKLHDGTTQGLFFIGGCKKAYLFVSLLP
ncbi:hypothetical protein BDF14DRAFT_1868225 [Spinellus fusiger]|nr:hypothetical protein BDF14DRAFT_1868225 [Spinellus fusiger]